MKVKTYRELSRIDWGSKISAVEEDYSPSNEELRLGAILRIADSLEILSEPLKMFSRQVKEAQDWTERIASDRAGYQQSLRESRKECSKLKTLLKKSREKNRTKKARLIQ